MESPKTTASAPTAKAGSCYRSDRLTPSEVELHRQDLKDTYAEMNRLWWELEAADEAKAKAATSR